jgi:hypothetical protein
MATGIAAHAVAVELLVELAFAHLPIDDIAERGHQSL